MRGSTTRPRGQRGRAAASQVGPAAADDGFVLDCAQLGTFATADAAPGRQLLLARTLGALWCVRPTDLELKIAN